MQLQAHVVAHRDMLKCHQSHLTNMQLLTMTAVSQLQVSLQWFSHLIKFIRKPTKLSMQEICENSVQKRQNTYIIPVINLAEMCVHKKLFLYMSDGAAAVVEGVIKLLKYMVNIHKNK